MTQETFELMKADFTATYQSELCEESLADVAKAEDVNMFIDILIKNAIHFYHKPIPSTEWVCKWFSNELEVANSKGCYINQSVVLKDPKERVLIFFGKCDIAYMTTKPKLHEICLRDESTLTLMAYGVSCTWIRTIGDKNKIVTLVRDNTANVKIKSL